MTPFDFGTIGLRLFAVNHPKNNPKTIKKIQKNPKQSNPETIQKFDDI